MNYQYRLEDVDATVTKQLEKEKEDQREKQKKAWEAELPQGQRETPQQLQSAS